MDNSSSYQQNYFSKKMFILVQLTWYFRNNFKNLSYNYRYLEKYIIFANLFCFNCVLNINVTI